MQSMQKEKLMAEFCIRFSFRRYLARMLKIALSFSSAIKEKSRGVSVSRSWWSLLMKMGGSFSFSSSSRMTDPGASGCRNDLTYNGIFLF